MPPKRPGRSGSDGDIPAIAMVTKDTQNIRDIQDPPQEHKAIVKYRAQTEEVFKTALKTTREVNDYAERINKVNEELKAALRETTTRVNDAMQQLVQRFQQQHMHARNNVPHNPSSSERPLQTASSDGDDYTPQPLSGRRARANRRGKNKNQEPPVPSGLEMKCLQELLEMDKMRMELEAAITQTQIMVDKMKNNVNYTNADFETLQEHIKNLQSTEQDMIEQENERKRQNEEEKKRKDREKQEKRERERQKKLEEEKEKRRLEEEEKRRLEEEERLRKLEEERLRLEEEERIRQEEEERLRREEEERRIREEEKKKRLEEEARQKRLEEEARRKREEEERLAAEQKERERRRRLDPNNWEPIVYTRNDAVGEGSSTSHHQGVCCVATAIQNAISEDDLQCLASDDADDIIDALEDGDKVVSSVVSINSIENKVSLEAPMRVFLPYQPITDGDEVISLKISIDGGGWRLATPVELPARRLIEQNARLVGIDMNDFHEAKIVAVAHSRSQSFIVDKSGTRTGDNRVQIFVPRDAFREPTELKLSVESIPDEVLQTIESGSDFIGTIIKGGPLITLDTPTAPAKQIEIDIMTSSDSVRSMNGQPQIKGKTHALVKSRKGTWQLADVAYKDKSKARTISLPTAKSSYSLLELEVTPGMSTDDVKRRADEVYECMTRSFVRMIVKQKEATPEQVMIHCVRRNAVVNRLKELNELGYTLGPDTSGEFNIADGQRLKISCSGNIESSLKDRRCVVVPFFAYMDTAKLEIMINVKDQYKQKDLPHYVGNIHCQVLSPGVATDDNCAACEVDIQLPVSLPKVTGKTLHLKTVPVRLPHYWCALATFLAWKLTDNYMKERGIDWCSILTDLIGSQSKMKRLLSRAKTKIPEAGGEMELCHVMLEDWMKTTNVYDDKLGPVMIALRNHGLVELVQNCVDLVEYHRDHMSDKIMRGWAEKLGSDVQKLAVKLNVAPSVVDACVAVNPGDFTNQVTSLLMEWRSSLVAMEMGTSAIGFLASLEL